MNHILQIFSHLSLFLFLVTVVPSQSKKSEKKFTDDAKGPTVKASRRGRLFPMFQIVTFPNEACFAGTRNGTCYTAEECSARSGTISGATCANGFGVCCIFSYTCGQMSNENCTYFENPSTISTEDDCNLEVCPCSNNICQIRLDFENFVITGPSTDSTTRGGTRDGNFIRVPGGAAPTDFANVANVGQCLTDLFTVTSPGNSVPPPVCGTLTGEHMYADLNDGVCDNLRFSFNPSGQGASITTRTWMIKITQYDCNYNNLAPPGCTQYFFGDNAGQIMSFNFGDQRQHLADQDQNICIRRESQNCRICYVPTLTTDFQLSGPSDFAARPDSSKFCCNYGNDGLVTNGFDCLEIPGVTGVTVTEANPADRDALNSRFCGRVGFKADPDGGKQTVCTFLTPFSVRFRSDRYEFLNNGTMSEGASPDVGFRLAYLMDATGCQI